MNVTPGNVELTFDLMNEAAENRMYLERKKGYTVFCDKCGRGVNPDTGWAIEVVEGGAEICRPRAGDDTDSGYMGWWVLGSECAKKVPATHRARYNDIFVEGQQYSGFPQDLPPETPEPSAAMLAAKELANRDALRMIGILTKDYVTPSEADEARDMLEFILEQRTI